jgi:hypothetical protein
MIKEMNDLTPTQIDYYLKNGSFLGLKALYICFCAYKTKSKIVLNNLEKNLTVQLSKEYVYGWIIQAHSIGLMKINKDGTGIFIIEMNNYLESTLEHYIKDIGKKIDSKYSFEPGTPSSRLFAVEEIESAFKYKPSDLSKN